MSLVNRCKTVTFCLISALIFELIFQPFAMSQNEKIRVENIHFEQKGYTINIYYDLVGPADKNYNVSIKLKREDYKSFEYVPKGISGDVGEGYFSGKNRKIIWNMLDDSPRILDQFQFYFEVNAEIVTISSTNPLFWIGGAVVIGGVALLLLSSGGDETTIQSHLPTSPPGRP